MQQLQWFLSTFIIGGFVLFCYLYFLSQCSKTRLWAGLSNPSIQTFYIASITLSAICYLILWIFYLSRPVSISMHLGNYLFLVGALLWPLFLYFIPYSFVSLTLALTITSLGALLLVISSCLTPVFYVGIFLCCLYLFLHVFVLDNVYWLLSYKQNVLRLH